MKLTNALHGKTINWVATDEQRLVLGFTDGTEVGIKWTEEGPEFAGQAVRVILPPVFGRAETGDI